MPMLYQVVAKSYNHKACRAVAKREGTVLKRVGTNLDSSLDLTVAVTVPGPVGPVTVC